MGRKSLHKSSNNKTLSHARVMEEPNMGEQLGYDCPMCKHSDMEYIGQSMQPIMITTYKKGKIIRYDSYYCELYRCKECNHIEWKAISSSIEDPNRVVNEDKYASVRKEAGIAVVA